MNFKTIAILATLTVVAAANAQSRSSFQKPTTLTGVTTQSLGNSTYRVSLGNNARVTLGGKQYKVTDLFGFYKLDNNDDYSATGRSQYGWSFVSNYGGTGGAAGFKTTPNNGLQRNESISLKFDCENGAAECFGYHLRLQDVNGCNTTTALVSDCAPVPEPATLLGLLAGAPLLRRRKK